MVSTESLFEASISRYRELLEKTRLVKKVLQNGDVKPVQTLTSELQEAASRVAEADRSLAANLEAEVAQAASQRIEELHRQRLKLITELKEETDTMIPRIKGSMAVAREELIKLTKGRKLVTGYHSNLDRTGRKINVSK